VITLEQGKWIKETCELIDNLEAHRVALIRCREELIKKRTRLEGLIKTGYKLIEDYKTKHCTGGKKDI
jgi:hypothetical protein